MARTVYDPGTTPCDDDLLVIEDVAPGRFAELLPGEYKLVTHELMDTSGLFSWQPLQGPAEYAKLFV